MRQPLFTYLGDSTECRKQIADSQYAAVAQKKIAVRSFSQNSLTNFDRNSAIAKISARWLGRLPHHQSETHFSFGRQRAARGRSAGHDATDGVALRTLGGKPAARGPLLALLQTARRRTGGGRTPAICLAAGAHSGRLAEVAARVAPNSDLDHTRFGCVPTGGGRTRACIGAAHSRCCHASTAPLGAALRTAAGPQPQRMRPLRSFPGSATGFPPVRGTLATAHSRQHRVPHAPPFGRPAAPSACASLGQPAARPPLLQRAGGRPRWVEGRAPGKARRRLEAAAPSVQRRWQAATGAGAVGASGAVATHCVLARVWGHRPPRARLSLWRCCHPSSAPSGDAPNPQVSGSNAQAQRKQAGRRTGGTPACVGGQAGRFHITK